jgi:ABC-type metal ion transport system substrate-binding protein
MKKLLFALGFATIMVACGESSKNQSGMTEENAEENADELASPDMEADSAGGFQMDTVSTDDGVQPNDSIQ